MDTGFAVTDAASVSQGRSGNHQAKFRRANSFQPTSRVERNSMRSYSRGRSGSSGSRSPSPRPRSRQDDGTAPKTPGVMNRQRLDVTDVTKTPLSASHKKQLVFSMRKTRSSSLQPTPRRSLQAMSTPNQASEQEDDG